MPGGHIDEEDDSIESGAIRELEEEANLTCKLSDLQYLGQKGDNKHYFFTEKWSGEVSVNKPNPKTNEIEHDAFKWATIEQIKEIDNTKIPIYLLKKALEMSKND